MFRELKRKEKKLSKEQSETILAAEEQGVLATIGQDGYPYAVPLNYVYFQGAVYFHCAMSGHKLDNISFNPKVSFCVYTGAEILAENCGQTVERIMKDFNRDYWMSADESVEYGIVDAVKTDV